MIRETANALVACVVTFVLCAVAYPAAVWGLGQLAFPAQAEGSLIYDRDRTVIGSELIAQPFTSEKYFFPRPSAVDYKADATGGSNLGTKNPDLRKKVVERTEAFKATTKNPVPVDLVTASGGGMDPHISPEGAYYQADRVAGARKMSLEQVRTLIAKHVETSGAIIGAPERVNVLRLNLALDEEKPLPPETLAPDAHDATSTSTPEPTPADAERKAAPAASALSSPAKTGDSAEVETLRTHIGEAAGQVEQLGKKLDALAASYRSQGQAAEGVKTLADRVARLADDTRGFKGVAERVNSLDGRLDAADASVHALRDAIRETHDSIKGLNGTSPEIRRGVASGR